MNDGANSFAARTYLKSSVVMTTLGYVNRSSFWEFVRKSGVPHIRLNRRNIIFEQQELDGWLARRSSSRYPCS